MIVPEEELVKYLGNQISSLEGIVQRGTLEKLGEYAKGLEDSSIKDEGLSLIDYLFLKHQQENKSLVTIARETGIARGTLRRIFDHYKLPTLQQAEAVKRNWEDPQFRERNSEAVKRNWEDPQFRERNAEATRRNWEDPQFKKRQAEGMRRNWEDPEFRERNAEAVRRELYQRWQDPQFRERNAEAVKRNWEDPQFRERNAEATRRNWEDPQFKKRQAEAVSKARLDPKNIARYYLPTIKGYRGDVGFDAQSSWEANFARILICCGRKFYTGETFILEVPTEYREIIGSDKTKMRVDFVSETPRGDIVMYEIMAHPLEEPIGYAKLELLIQQHPVDVHIIDKRLYKRLEAHFKARIDNDPMLAGWETSQDNLRTNPRRYGRIPKPRTSK